ncbi:MAG TPA: polymorphic toxin type 17 domain-containing protein [Gemmataceae bacterium]|nr:polymorphic toxin type 17 domain-containing protein [Gemmataceae bacterium]
MSVGGGWPTRYPWRLLPRGGRHPYVPPLRGNWLKHPPRGPQRGYLDDAGNEWVPHPHPSGREEDFHWDVQHHDGRHTNVRPDGEVHHGDDNFA